MNFVSGGDVGGRLGLPDPEGRLMRTLELKVPPPLVTLLAAAAMWGIARVTPAIEASARMRLIAAIVIALAGIATGVSGVTAFRRAKTTTNPLKPETSSSLVTSGIYRFTRNPMYVGLALVLLAWAVFLSSPWALLGIVVFVLYMNRFQIMPEERILAGMFGTAYSAYQGRVRRWL
jgi:protein-S-isoprenylcysteine O-methyltransferase Ste14